MVFKLVRVAEVTLIASWGSIVPRGYPKPLYSHDRNCDGQG
ncbi:MAG: hypothetical protein ACO2OZ_09185 [Acidilobaceae archaeon]